jgi:small-conductance mechanosensitive channel
MAIYHISLNQLLLPLGILSVSILAGLFVKNIFLKHVEHITRRTPWAGDEIVIAAIRRMTVVWFILGGAYIASFNLPLTEKIISHIQRIILALTILTVTASAADIIAGLVRIYTGRIQGNFPSTTIFTNLTKIIVFIFGFLIVLQALSIPITPLITAMGVGGLAVALALQDSLSNLFSGLQIIASRQLAPGDYVRLDTGEEGFVTDITWRNTTIRALPNNTIIVPNAKLAQAIITNYNLPERELSIIIPVGVSYSSDLERVERITIEVARGVLTSVEGGIPDFTPLVRFHTFGDSSVEFSVILRARGFVDQYLLKHEFVKRLHKRYHDEGIEIPFPIRTIYMKNAQS